jgi:hypothetical protein
MVTPRPRLARAAAVGALLVVVVACGDGDHASPADEADASIAVTSRTAPPPVAPPALPDPATLSPDTMGLTGTLEQYREDEARNLLAIKVANGGTDDVRIDTLQLAWPGLVGAEPATPGYVVAAGVRVDLRVGIGRAVCSDPPRFDEPVPGVPIAATATIGGATVTFSVTDPNGILDRVYPKACRAQAVEHAVAIEFASTWVDASADPPTVTNTLTFTRRHGAEPIEISGVFGTVVVSLAGDGLPRRIEPDDQRVSVPVTFTNNRCDAHALGETKKPFLFQVQLVIGDQDVSYFLTPDDAGKDALAAGILDRCPPEPDP